MSEYQYYEFRAIDRPLTPKEMDELRGLSTRAEITPRSFTNEYHYGSFRGDPKRMMEKYFDLFVYVANYGSRRLMIRVPAKLLPLREAEPYCDGESLDAWEAGGNLVVSFEWHDEPTGWEDGETYVDDLVGLRDELMSGDLRPLYLGWLAGRMSGEWQGRDEDPGDELEPPVPPGMSKLSAAQEALAEFLMIDEHLIDAAAEDDPGKPPAAATDEELAAWVKALSVKEKDGYLIRLISKKGDPSLAAELLRRFRKSSRPNRNASKAPRRKVAALLARRDELDAKKQAARARAEKKQVDRQQKERAAHLDALAGREGRVWADVEAKLELKTQDAYDEAVALMVDLRDLALRDGRKADFETRLRDIRQRHRSKSSLLRRLAEKFPAR